MSPEVTIIIPTYNRRELLGEAIRSCFAGNEALDMRVLVVDDGSTDETRSFLRSLSERDRRMRFVFQENQGAQVARNRGLREACGTFVKFLDSDDLLIEGALVQEVEKIKDTNAEVSYGNIASWNADGGQSVFQQEASCKLVSGIFVGNIWTHPPVFLYRRSLLERLEWDPKIPYHQDTAFAIDAAVHSSKSTHTEQVVAVHRWHEGDRISTFKSSASTAERLLLQVRLICSGLRRLRQCGKLQDEHRRAAAEGLWQWAHMLAIYDPKSSEAIYRRVESLLPGYRPRRSSTVLCQMDALWGARVTERLILPFRWLINGASRFTKTKGLF